MSGAWEAPGDESEPLMAMLRGAVANEEANTQFHGFIEARLEHGSGVIDHDDRALRAGLAAAMLVVISSRRIIRVPTLVAADHDRVVTTLGPAIQSVLVRSELAAACPLPLSIADRQPGPGDSTERGRGGRLRIRLVDNVNRRAQG